MAVTKLMHLKESPGVPSTHLKNAIMYILDVKHGGKKTEYGTYVGGNAGSGADEILAAMLGTKEAFGKQGGRQGYHFVISFPPKEADAKTAYAVAGEFCEAYLGDAYDYVYAVHSDKRHMHAHIIFNSVSRTTGYKYHYRKGDWEKYIQPVTDRACRGNGLQELEFTEERAGISYASWAHRQAGRLNWSHIIQADIDYAVSRSCTYAEFEDHMLKMQYTLRLGWSKKRAAAYVTYKFTGEDGKTHSRRSYNLPPGYGIDEITARIAGRQGTRVYEEVAGSLAKKAEPYLAHMDMRLTGTRTYKRLYQAASYYRLPNPYAVPAARVRNDMLRIDRLLEECRYLARQPECSMESLESRYRTVDGQIRLLAAERRKWKSILGAAGPDAREAMERYRSLQRELDDAAGQHLERVEETEDAMQRIKQQLPHDMLLAEGRINLCTRQLKGLYREKKLLAGILEESKKDGLIQKPAIRQ